MKKVLLAGPCYADTISLKKALESMFEVSVFDVTRVEDARNILRQRKIDLILVSRIFTGDKKEGLGFIKYIKKEYNLPVIMLTRFPDVQKQALESGAQAAFDMDLLIDYIRPSMEEKHREAIKAIEKCLT